jgi:hypothetical protein
MKNIQGAKSRAVLATDMTEKTEEDHTATTKFYGKQRQKCTLTPNNEEKLGTLWNIFS